MSDSKGSERALPNREPLIRRPLTTDRWICPGCGMAIYNDEPRVSLDIGIIVHATPRCIERVGTVFARDLRTMSKAATRGE